MMVQLLRKGLTALLIVVFHFSLCTAQELSFQHINTKGYTVKTIYRDVHGIVWLGTSSGLVSLPQLESQHPERYVRRHAERVSAAGPTQHGAGHGGRRRQSAGRRKAGGADVCTTERLDTPLQQRGAARQVAGLLQLKGLNLLNVTQLKDDARLHRIFIGLWPPFAPEPRVRIEARDYESKHDGRNGHVSRVEQLCYCDGVTVMPFDTPSYQLSDGRPQVFSIHAGDFTAEWRRNVLFGYASRQIDIPVSAQGRQRLHIYLLDPGIVLQEVNVHQQ